MSDKLAREFQVQVKSAQVLSKMRRMGMYEKSAEANPLLKEGEVEMAE